MIRFDKKGWIGAAAALLAFGAMGEQASAQTRSVARVDTVGSDTLSIRVGRQGAEVVRYREGDEEIITIRRSVGDGEARRGSDRRRVEDDDSDGRRHMSFSFGDDDDDDDMDNDNDDDVKVYRNDAGDTIRVERRVRRRSGRRYRFNNWNWHRRERDDRFAASNGIFGGVDAVYQQLHADAFNTRLAPVGIGFDEHQLLLGGGIYLQGDHLRFGYTGAGWTQEETKLDAADVKRTATLRLGYGAFTGEYVWGFGHHRVELGIGGVIGQGRVKLGLNRQVGGDPSFDDVVGGIVADSVGRYTTTLEARPFIIGPRASIRLKLVGPFSFMASGAYLFGQSDKWRQNPALFDDKGLDVIASPTYKFNQPVVHVGLMFGS